ncbi:MAG: 4Fe-4S dicluster domain-containing protein [Thermoplasmatota archaeon]
MRTKPPEYRGIFQYMVENYSDPGKQSPEERFWVRDLEENQYKQLSGPVNSRRTDFGSIEEAAANIREFALSAGADIVGFTRVSPEMVFRGADVKGNNAIVMGYEMDFDAIATAPDPPAGKEALRAYWRLGHIVMKTAEYIRELGYPAWGHQVRTFTRDPPAILNTVAGEHAGLGEVGRLGVLITPEFGPRVRLGTVTTDLDLPLGGRRPFGVDEFCSHCSLCVEACAGNAIPREKRIERGHLKYTIDPYGCIPEFAKYDGCGICIKVCPFNQPGNKMERFLDRKELSIRGR